MSDEEFVPKHIPPQTGPIKRRKRKRACKGDKKTKKSERRARRREERKKKATIDKSGTDDGASAAGATTALPDEDDAAASAEGSVAAVPETDEEKAEAAAVVAEAVADARASVQAEMREDVGEVISGATELIPGPISTKTLIFRLSNETDGKGVSVDFEWFKLLKRGGTLPSLLKQNADSCVNLRVLTEYPPQLYTGHEAQWKKEHFYRMSPVVLLAHKPTHMYALAMNDVFAAVGTGNNPTYNMRRLTRMISEAYEHVPYMPPIDEDLLFPISHSSGDLDGRRKSKGRRIFPAVLLPFLPLVTSSAYYATIERALHCVEMRLFWATESGEERDRHTYYQYAQNRWAAAALLRTELASLKNRVDKLESQLGRVAKLEKRVNEMSGAPAPLAIASGPRPKKRAKTD